MITTILATISLCCFDKVLEFFNIEGRYYLNHFIINSIVVYYTFDEMLLCYTDIVNLEKYYLNMYSVEYVFSIHFYHIIIYYKKLLYDDWIHHIIMILLTLPMGIYFNNGPIMSQCLFFMCGLPGGINYLLLFLQRNNLLRKITQKYINYNLNLWIRNPGCISSAIINMVFYINIYKNQDILSCFFITYISLACYWNGVYFMEQVVRNYNFLYLTV